MPDRHAHLYPHPLSPCTLVDAIRVDVRVTEQTLHLDYQMLGRGSALAVPAPQEPLRTDNLWQQTCCELFVKAAERDAYYEMNLSPSSQWACYHFARYREGMADARLGAPPIIQSHSDAMGLTLRAEIDLSLVPPDFAAQPLFLGLSCVVVGRAGEKSFWALNHPPEKPDFHHDDCFALQIGAAIRP